MKFQNFTTLALGIYSFFGLCVSSINADDSFWLSESTDGPTNKVQQYHPRRPPTRVNVIGGGNDYPIKAATVVASPAEEHPRNLKKRATEPWTVEEVKLLLELKDQRGLPWDEIRGFYPERSGAALRTKYQALTREPVREEETLNSWTEEENTFNPWTEEENILLIELAEADIPWEDVARRFSGRSIPALREQYHYLTRDRRIAGSAYRPWTPEEDELLLKMVEDKVPWEERLAFFDDRSLTALWSRLAALRRSRRSSTSEEDRD